MSLRKGRGRKASTSANKRDADEAACGGLGDAALLSSGVAEDISAVATIVKSNPAPLRKVALTRSSKKPSLNEDEAACGGLGDASLLSSGVAEDINDVATIVKRNPAPLRKVALTRSSKKPSLYVQARNPESATFNTYLHYSFDAVLSHYLIARCQNELPAMESICFTYAVHLDEYVPCCSFLLFIPFCSFLRVPAHVGAPSTSTTSTIHVI